MDLSPLRNELPGMVTLSSGVAAAVVWGKKPFQTFP